MTATELLEDFDAEMAGTRRTLERIPETPDYKPHEKSMACGKLVMHVATLPLFAKYIMSEPGMDLAVNNNLAKTDLTFRTRDITLATFDSAVEHARKVIAAAAEEDLAKKWKFCFGDHVISDDSRSKTYRVMFFNHLIHHRAQLGMYLRLNDLPVPGLYGPSADEPFQA